MNLPWLDVYQKQFTDLLLHERLPHALLIAGGKGLGKLQLAQNIAQLALCENVTEQGICHRCPACLLYKAHNHTDYAHISAETSTIKVEQIRKLSRDIMLSSARHRYKVILIQEAEKMNKAAANALLKTLEEPPNKVIIILTTNEIGRLLPTIKSRCMQLSISPPEFNQAIEWLNAGCNHTSQDNELSLVLTNNAPLLALSMLENDDIKSIKAMLNDLQSLSQRDKSVLEVSQAWMSNESLHLLPSIAAYFLFILKCQYEINGLKNDVNHIDGMNHLSIKPQLLEFVKEIYLCNQRLTTVLKPQLLLEELLIRWQKGSYVQF